MALGVPGERLSPIAARCNWYMKGERKRRMGEQQSADPRRKGTPRVHDDQFFSSHTELLVPRNKGDHYLRRIVY